ncbi:hypothetical protein [Ereboglobus sp. PH5-10]|uniref:hypothetical protein n=1 Tax=Ereboglobus sp. PH5-10 TaxID=2940629 RepID=UPI002405686B|nr:hypothetical protein [Ereboglobus sp. PH5-10]
MAQRTRKDRRPEAGHRIILSRKTSDKIAAQADGVEDFAKKILAAGSKSPVCEIPHNIPAGAENKSADRAINKAIGKILARPKRSRAKNPHTARVRELLAATLRDEIVQSVPGLVQTYLIGAMKIYQAEHSKWARNGNATARITDSDEAIFWEMMWNALEPARAAGTTPVKAFLNGTLSELMKDEPVMRRYEKLPSETKTLLLILVMRIMQMTPAASA